MNQSISATRDGFHLMKDRFEVPKDTSALDPKTKRAVTICNLFLNYQLSLHDIVRVLDEDNGSVVLALLERRIIQDRRSKPRDVPVDKERRKSLANLRTEGR